MWKLYRMELKYEVYSNINYFFRFLQKIKILGSMVSDEYRYVGLKRFAAALSWLYKILKSLFMGNLIAFVLFFIYTGLNNILMKPADPGVMAAFFAAVYILMNIMQSRVLGATQKIHLFHEVFRQSARDVARVELFFTPLMSFIGRSAGFLVVFSVLHALPPMQAILLSLMVTAADALTEWIHLKLLDAKLPLEGKPSFVLTVLLLTAVTMFLMTLFGVDISNLLEHPAAWIVTSLVLAGSFLLAWHYKNYNQVVRFVTGQYEKQLNLKQGNNLRTMDVQLRDSDYGDLKQSAAVVRAVEGLSGYARLNALFFARHKRILRKPIMIFTYIAAALGVIGLVFLWFNRTHTYWHPFKIGVFYDSLGAFIPFFMYLSIGDKRLTKSLFVNCDASLLTYSFYRRPDDILTSYNMRLKEVIWLNMPPAAALMASLAIWLSLSGMAITPARLILFPLIMAYYVFFTIHLLFLYYILQPYTQDVQVKNPLYKIIDFAVYLFCYMPLFLKPDMTIHAVFIIILTIIYALVARTLIPRLAPKTFRIK